MPSPKLTGATLFSGIHAPEVAMPWVEWKFCAEIEEFPAAVGSYRHPHIPNLGDVTAHDFIDRAKQHGPIDLLVFGSPCQSFSVAGKRLGLDDPRGNLALVSLGIVDALHPRWFFFENVFGLLSSWSDSEEQDVESHDLAEFLSRVRDIGYFGCGRVLDAQYFGVPQRRRRFFFVGNPGDWRYSAAVLLEPEGLPRHHPPRDKARKSAAKPANASARLRRFWESLVGAFGEGTEGDRAGSAGEVRSVGAVMANTHPGSYCGQDAYAGQLIECADIAPTLNTTWGHRSAGSQAQEWDSERGGDSCCKDAQRAAEHEPPRR